MREEDEYYEAPYEYETVEIKKRRGCIPGIGCSGLALLAAVGLVLVVITEASAGVGVAFKIGDVKVAGGISGGNHDRIWAVSPWYMNQELGQDGKYIDFSSSARIGPLELRGALAADNTGKLFTPDGDFYINGVIGPG